MRVIDMVGGTYGFLTVVARDESKSKEGRAYWVCKCECGNTISVAGKALRRGHTKSCGCKSRELAASKCIKDLTGQRFGRLTAVSRGISPRTGKPAWLCKCDCGNEVYVSIENLRNGGQISCGCALFDIGKYNAEVKRTHGASSKDSINGEDYRLYTVWHSMRLRCYNKNNIGYHNYGGRGITVCDEWLNRFESFRDWAYANGYDNALPRGQCTLDRIDVNGNYEPSNCRWVTQKKQMNNTRKNRYFTIDGITHTMAEWSEIYGVPFQRVKDRIHNGWTIERALTEPSHRSKKS